MPFNVKIENIGKLEDAEIRIGKFTVLAGPNNSGKSFVSKTICSVFEALDGNYVERYIQQLIDPLFNRISWSTDLKTDPHGEQVRSMVQDLEDCVAGSQYRNPQEIDKTTTALVDHIDKLRDGVEQIVRTDPKGYLRREYESAVGSLEEIKVNLTNRDAHQIIENSISEELQRRIISNFQVSQVSKIKKEQDQPLVVNIDQIGSFEYSREGFNSQLHVSWPRRSIGFSTIIYLESPIYLKLMRALEYREFHDPLVFGPRRRMQLSGVPGYVFNLIDLLKTEFVGDIAFPEVYKKLTDTEIMGGQFTITDDGSIHFQENGKRHPLSIIGTGIANIGMLSLLIERKVLDKDSLLFVDEPEAHLHPAWQVFLAQSLFELARQGVHVVIATYSLEILKWLEVHVKKNPEDKQLVELNQFPMLNQPIPDNVEPRDIEDNLNQIKEELTQPFSKLYIEGL